MVSLPITKIYIFITHVSHLINNTFGHYIAVKCYGKKNEEKYLFCVIYFTETPFWLNRETLVTPHGNMILIKCYIYQSRIAKVIGYSRKGKNNNFNFRSFWKGFTGAHIYKITRRRRVVSIFVFALRQFKYEFY